MRRLVPIAILVAALLPLVAACQKKYEESSAVETGVAPSCDCDEKCPDCVCEEEGEGSGTAGMAGTAAGTGDSGP